MPKGIFFQCENCGQKAFSQIPSTWIHVSNLTLSVCRGAFRTTIESYDIEYQKFFDLTFCSMQCFLEWLSSKYPEASVPSNPSQRV